MLPERATTLLDGPACLTPPCRATRNGRMAKSLSRQTGGIGLWDFMAITKALADEQRVRMLLALQGRELCLCQLVELVGLASSTVSKHMSILRQSRLVEGRKVGRWVYYRLAGAGASAAVRQAVEWVRKSLADDPQVLDDAQRLARILKLDPEALCESQAHWSGKSGKPRPGAVGRSK